MRTQGGSLVISDDDKEPRHQAISNGGGAAMPSSAQVGCGAGPGMRAGAGAHAPCLVRDAWKRSRMEAGDVYTYGTIWRRRRRRTTHNRLPICCSSDGIVIRDYR